jgi:predicted phosphohydrolase
VRLVCISDTHSRHRDIVVPDGDVLVHAGDFTKRGREQEIADFNGWLAELPHRHKLVIAGNHDFLFERAPHVARGMLSNATYLEDSGCEIDGVRFWGSPWQPRFFDWAFNLDRGEPLRKKWERIPDRVDVLITHSPPHGVLDRVWDGQHVGCEELVAALARVRPRVHVFGHIHEAYGVSESTCDERDEVAALAETARTRFVNACSCDLEYEPVQPPVVLDL